MTGLWNGERHGSFGVVLGLLGMLCLLAAMVGIIVWQAVRFEKFVDVVVSRCETRLPFDLAAQESRRADLAVYQWQLSQETHPEGRRALEWGVKGKQLVLDNPPPGECDEYLTRLAAQ